MSLITGAPSSRRKISVIAQGAVGPGLAYESFAIADNTSSPITINKPSGTVSGDLLYVAIAIDSSGSVSAPLPSGWVEDGAMSNGGQSTLKLCHKVAGGSEPASYDFLTSGLRYQMGAILRISGADNASPIHLTSDIDATSIGEGFNAAPTCPTITPTIDNTLVLRFFGSDGTLITTDTGYPAGDTGIFVRKSGGVVLGASYSVQTTAAATGTAAFTMTGTDGWCAATIAIKPAI